MYAYVIGISKFKVRKKYSTYYVLIIYNFNDRMSVPYTFIRSFFIIVIS